MATPKSVVSQGTLLQFPATIASGGTSTAGFATGNSSLCGVQMPAAFTGTHLMFQAATAIDGTYQDLHNLAGQVKYPAAASQFIAIDPKDFYGVQFLKIVSDGTEAADRALTCMMKGI